MSPELIAVLAVIIAAMAFDYTNGFHDAANAIATSVSTRALTPRVALAMAAVGNFVGAHFGAEVAKTVGDGLVKLPPGIASLGVVFAGVVGAIAWNLITWYFGLPSSSSHALFGGLVGATLFASQGEVQWGTIVDKVLIPMVASPFVGFILGFIVMVAIMWIFRRGHPGKLNRGFRVAQTISAAFMSVGHGMQDAAKTMGIIVLALYTGGFQDSATEIPWWVFWTSAAVLAAGTYSRRLAHHSHAGPQDHRPGSGGGLRVRDGGELRAVLQRAGPARADLDDAHDHLGDHGCRRHEAAERGPLEHG
nr:hypothetical protein GCM10020092_007850 [Actinoplanes digitatis]